MALSGSFVRGRAQSSPPLQAHGISDGRYFVCPRNFARTHSPMRMRPEMRSGSRYSIARTFLWTARISGWRWASVVRSTYKPWNGRSRDRRGNHLPLYRQALLPLRLFPLPQPSLLQSLLQHLWTRCGCKRSFRRNSMRWCKKTGQSFIWWRARPLRSRFMAIGQSCISQCEIHCPSREAHPQLINARPKVSISF